PFKLATRHYRHLGTPRTDRTIWQPCCQQSSPCPYCSGKVFQQREQEARRCESPGNANTHRSGQHREKYAFSVTRYAASSVYQFVVQANEAKQPCCKQQFILKSKYGTALCSCPEQYGKSDRTKQKQGIKHK